MRDRLPARLLGEQGRHRHCGVCTSNLLVKSYYSQKNKLIWASAILTTNGVTNSDKTTNSSAEKKGVWKQKSQGLSTGVHTCFCTTEF